VEQYEEIDIQPGYQALCGFDALDYARFRHLDNDVVRAARQQDFLREARHKVPPEVVFAQRTRNWAKPLQRLGQTSVFRFPVGGNAHILERFRADPQGVADTYRYEQHFITASVTGGVQLWPEGWTRHFRLHCLPMFPLRLWKDARVPPGSKIVTSPGGPNPDLAVVGAWNHRAPPRSAWDHVRATFGPASGRVSDRRWRHLTSFVRPVPWIAEHWRE
jgi:hypothetical protein